MQTITASSGFIIQSCGRSKVFPEVGRFPQDLKSWKGRSGLNAQKKAECMAGQMNMSSQESMILPFFGTSYLRRGISNMPFYNGVYYKIRSFYYLLQEQSNRLFSYPLAISSGKQSISEQEKVYTSCFSFYPLAGKKEHLRANIFKLKRG